MIEKWIALLIVASLGGAENEVSLMDHFKRVSFMDPTSSAYVYRMDVDLTGDGCKEILLGHSQSSGNAGVTWQVYSPREGDGKLRFIGRLLCHFGGFGYDSARSEIVLGARNNAASGWIFRYKVDAHGIQEVHRTDLLDSDDPGYREEIELIRNWQESASIEVLWATVEEYGSLKSLEWREFKTQELRKSARSFDDLIVVESEDDFLK